MPLCSSFRSRFRVVNDRDKPVAILTNVEDHVSPHAVRVFESPAQLRKIVPTNLVNYNYPSLDLVGRIRIFLHGLAKMAASDDVHAPIVLHNM